MKELQNLALAAAVATGSTFFEAAKPVQAGGCYEWSCQTVVAKIVEAPHYRITVYQSGMYPSPYDLTIRSKTHLFGISFLPETDDGRIEAGQALELICEAPNPGNLRIFTGPGNFRAYALQNPDCLNDIKG